MISLLYCGNDKVFRGLMISLISVTEHTDEPLDVHLLTMNYTELKPEYTPISSAQSEFIEKMLKEYNPESRVTLHDVGEKFKSVMQNSPNLASVYTPYAMLRLFADQLKLPDKILYLDTDTAAIGDVSTIYNTDITGYDYAGVLDYLGKIFINPKYINTGVLLLNIAEIRESGLFERARHFCATKKAPFPDQDALNRLEKKKFFLPRGANEQRRMRKDTVIRHFSKSIRWLPFYHTVNIKPWDIEGLHKVYRTYEFDPVLEKYMQRLSEWESFKNKKGEYSI